MIIFSRMINLYLICQHPQSYFEFDYTAICVKMLTLSVITKRIIFIISNCLISKIMSSKILKCHNYAILCSLFWNKKERTRHVKGITWHVNTRIVVAGKVGKRSLLTINWLFQYQQSPSAHFLQPATEMHAAVISC